MQKLRSNRGETLVETLSALLIAVLVMAFLALAVVTASQINKKTDGIDSPLVYTDASKKSEPVKVTVKKENSTTVAASVDVYEYTTADGRYHYYKKE